MSKLRQNHAEATKWKIKWPWRPLLPARRSGCQAIKAAQRGAGRRGKAGKKAGKKKRGFGARKLGSTTDEKLNKEAMAKDVQEIELIIKSHGDSSGAPANSENQHGKASAGHRSQDSFRMHTSDTGHTYYENTGSGETVWQLPEGAAVIN